MAIKIGVDTGGTFSDFMLMDGDTLVIHKVLSTPDNPARAVLQGLRHLRPDLTGVDVVHGSTVATKAEELRGKASKRSELATAERSVEDAQAANHAISLCYALALAASPARRMPSLA